ncbi:MAG: porin PorA family protein [Chloroflexi bacterium]|nr:porin PorA family protein [Chloroflexota bacterium]
MKPMRKPIFIALAFLVLAALLRFWIAPLLEQLPANYSSETLYTNENQIRDSPTGKWITESLISRRVDQAISAKANTLIVEGALHVYFEDGSVNFETAALYGVDRRTRENVPGLGDTIRDGQFLFPPHVQQGRYVYWDPIYIGPRMATFDHIEQINGLRIYVFGFTAENLDETKGYDYLPDVPERYRAVTNGQGILWIEPISGIVVDYEDQGAASFVNPGTGAPVAEFSRWDERYTPETRATQLRLASEARLRSLLFEVWLPGGLALAGLGFLALDLFRRKKTSRRLFSDDLA